MNVNELVVAVLTSPLLACSFVFVYLY